jgi:DNA-directed RNA polymerase subunit RPC12/RpoP
MEIKIYGTESRECVYGKITEDCIKDGAVGEMLRMFLERDNSILTPSEVQLLAQFGRQIVEYFRKPAKPKDGDGNIRQVFKCPDCDADLQEKVGHQHGTSELDCTKCGFHKMIVWKNGLSIQQPTKVFVGRLA